VPQIPDWQLLRLLGQGGWGRVYLAEDGKGRLAAIKAIEWPVEGEQDEELREKVKAFLREMDEQEKLVHPNLVRYLGRGLVEGKWIYFVMEYVEGPDLDNRLLALGRPYEVGEARRIAVSALRGLEHIHERGMVHRDVKPRNIVLAPTGEAKILDFGLTKSFLTAGLSIYSFTKSNTVKGTPYYMAPEQYTEFRYVKPPADVYSFGATLYFMLARETIFDPWLREDTVTLTLYREPVPVRQRNPEVPEWLAKVIHKCLEKSPEMRYPDARALREAIERGES
jgi:serine/threonine-protein kinase